MQSTTKSFLMVVLSLGLAGCMEDIAQEKQAWGTMTKEWDGKVEALTKSHDGMMVKAKGLTVAATDEAGTKAKSQLDAALTTEGSTVAEMKKAVADAKTAVETAITAGKKEPLKTAMAAAQTNVTATLTKATEMMTANGKMLEDLGKQLAEGKVTDEKTKAEMEQMMALLKKKGSTIDLKGIAFKANAAELDAEKAESKAELQKMVAMFKSCSELKANLALTTVGEAKELGEKRAEALKAYLTGAGVAGTALGAATSKTQKKGEEKLTFTVETPCK